MLQRRKCVTSSKVGDRRTSYFAEGWSTMTRIAELFDNVKGQGNEVKAMRSCCQFDWCTVAHNWTTKSRRNTKIGRKVVRATADILRRFQGQESPGRSGWPFKSPLAGGGAYRVLWRPHSLFIIHVACMTKSAIDVKKTFFYVFYLGNVFTFLNVFILPFFIFKNVHWKYLWLLYSVDRLEFSSMTNNNCKLPIHLYFYTCMGIIIIIIIIIKELI